MAVDEYGREPGIDYSDQSWTIFGLTTGSLEISTLIESLDNEQLIAVLESVKVDPTIDIDAAIIAQNPPQ